MYDFHMSFSGGIWYCFAFDEFHRPSGRCKSSSFADIQQFIYQLSNIPVDRVFSSSFSLIGGC